MDLLVAVSAWVPTRTPGCCHRHGPRRPRRISRHRPSRPRWITRVVDGRRIELIEPGVLTAPFPTRAAHTSSTGWRSPSATTLSRRWWRTCERPWSGQRGRLWTRSRPRCPNGFVFAPDHVMTNAHVVAGVRDGPERPKLDDHGVGRRRGSREEPSRSLPAIPSLAVVT